MFDQLLSFLVGNAHAEPVATTAAPAQASGFSFIFMFVIFIFFIYFAVWRPQNKRAKEQATLLNSLAKGDEIITAGGLLGKITKIAEQYITLNIANNVDIVVQKNSVVNVLPKGTIKAIE